MRMLFSCLRGKHLSKSHSLSRYTLFIDPDGLLKISGRVRDLANPKLARQHVPTPSHVFEHTGIYIAGPFVIRQGHTRRPILLKSYACLFVCFATRAVDLELCADLSTEEFLAAFHRFCTRRGAPRHVYTDNGFNFVGARNEIQELQRLHLEVKESFSHFCSEASITWHFIPPRTLHFGGLWESGVKSMKVLLIHSSSTN